MFLNVRDIIKNCAKMLSLNEVEAYLDSPLKSERGKKDFDDLLRCLNIVYNEVLVDYIPLKKKENIQLKNQRFVVADLAKPCVEILGVFKDGMRLNFRVDIDEVIINSSGIVEVYYRYLPKALAEGDQTELPVEKLNLRTLSYGVLGEYCLFNGLYEDSLMYDRRYRDAILSQVRTSRSRTIKSRRWL